VVGTVLLLGVVVVVSASIGVTVLDFPKEVTPTSVTPGGDGDAACQSVEFDPTDVDEFADEHDDCTSGPTGGDGAYQGAVMWFDASQEGFSSGGESVDRWTDQSGNGHDAVVLRGNPQGYADVDGVPAVEFEKGLFASSGDVFTAEATTAEANLDGETEFAISVVIQPNGPFANYLAVGNDNTGTFTGRVSSGFSQNIWAVYNSTVDEDGNYNNGTTDSTVPQAEPWTVVTYTYNRTSVSLYVNGELQEQDDHDDIELDIHGDITVGGVPSGGPLDFNGAIAELVIYDRSLDDDQRERLECGFDDKYGSAVSVTGC
jgi:hypothetical protein